MFNKLKKVIQSRQYLRKICRHLKMVIVRRWYGLKSVHSTFYLGGRADIARDFHAGPYSYVGRDCCICPKVSIGAYTLLAHEVSIQGGDHRYDIPGTPICFSGRPPMLATVIEEDAWIGHRAIIIAGITIGRGAIVGAGAVVTKDVPPYTIVGGIPAKKIGERFPDEFDCIVHDKMLNDEPKEQTLPGWRTPHDY